MEDKDYDKIELRSDKVRRIIGRVPPRLVRTGTAVIAVAMTALLFAEATVHFPITVEAHGGVVDGGLKVEVPYRFLYLFDRPRVAWVRFEGEAEGTRHAYTVDGCCPELHATPNGNTFTAHVSLPNVTHRVYDGQKAEVRIVVSDKTIWQQIIRR